MDDQLPAAPAQTPAARACSPSFLTRLTPRQLAEQADRPAVVAECRAAIAAAEPAHPKVMAVALDRLALHYPERQMAEKDQARLYGDWRRLIGDIPIDLLDQAIDSYLLSPARFHPTPGQLLELVRRDLAYRKGMAERAAKALSIIENPSRDS